MTTEGQSGMTRGRARSLSDSNPLKTFDRSAPKPKPRKSAKSTCKKGRSKSQVYIVFIGQSGSGKSTTLNFMFGNEEIAPVERGTGSDKIHEFTAEVPDSESKNEKLTLIDTPGLGDMNSIDWDGRISKTLHNYFTKQRELVKHYPNVVVLFGRFDDNRIDGENSKFVKMLKAVASLSHHLFDKDGGGNNLMVVLTHYMNGKKALREDPKPRVELVRNLIAIHLNHEHEIKVQVVLAENEPEDWELEESAGSFLLKNGSRYPEDVFKTMINICSSGKDELGEKVLKTAHQKRKELSKKFKLTEELSLVNELEAENITAFLAHTYNTSTSSFVGKLRLQWNSLGKSIEDAAFLNFVKLLARENIKELPKTLQDINYLFHTMEQDIDLFRLLESVGCVPANYVLRNNVGSGYNIVNDNFTDKSCVDTESSLVQYQVSILPYRLPKYITSTNNISENEVVICECVDNIVSYSKERLKRIRGSSCKAGSEMPNNFTFDSRFRDGYNLTPEMKNKLGSSGNRTLYRYEVTPLADSSNSNCQRLRKEFRIAKLEVSGEPINIQISDKASLAAKKLKPYNKKDRIVRSQWRDFFSQWGTHVVKSVYVGGACTVEIADSQLSDLKKMLSKTHGDNKDIMLHLITFNLVPTPSGPRYLDKVTYKVRFQGGINESPQWNDCIYPPNQSQVDRFVIWKSSLKYNPVALENDIELMPIKSLFRHSEILNVDYESACDDLIVAVSPRTTWLTKIAKFFTNLLKSKKSS